MSLYPNSFRRPGEKTFSQRCRLFVGNLPPNLPENKINSMFEKYGEVSEVLVNRERCFGFVTMETRILATIAKAELDGTVLNNRPITIRFAQPGASLTVRNLLPSVTNELLGQAFSQFGTVERAVVVTDDCGRSTGRGIVEFTHQAAARKALERCTEGALLLTATPCPVRVEPSELYDDEDGMPEKLLQKTPKLHKERVQPPRFAQPGTFDFEYASRWKALSELDKQMREQVDKSIKEAKEKLEAELEAAKHENQLMLMRQDLMRRQEELRRLEELRNQELQRRKQIEMRHEEERRRREEEMMRHREQEDLRRQPDAFKPSYMENGEQEMRSAGDQGPHGAVNLGDGYSQSPAGPRSNDPAGSGHVKSDEEAPVEQETKEGEQGPHGAMNVTDGYNHSNAGPRSNDPAGSLLSEDDPTLLDLQQQQQQQQQQHQQPLGPQVGAANPGFGGGSPGYDGPNVKRRRY